MTVRCTARGTSVTDKTSVAMIYLPQATIGNVREPATQTTLQRRTVSHDLDDPSKPAQADVAASSPGLSPGLIYRGGH